MEINSIRHKAVKLGKVLLATFLLFSLLPYLLPLPRPGEEGVLPFAESRRADIQGINLHYRVWKPGEVRGKVLLVHGLGGSTFSWRNNVEALVEEGYLVAAVDLPGFGYSSRRKGVDHSQEGRGKLLWGLIQQLEASLDHEIALLGWNLVGHSMGGGTIAAMALQEPSRLGSLTFVAGAPYGRPPGGASLVFAFPPAARWLQVAAHYYFLTYERIEQLLASAYGRPPGPEEVAGYLEPLALPGTVNTLISMSRVTRNLTREDIREIRVPSLLLWGDEDAWVPLEAGEELARDLPLTQLLIFPGTGHCPMETRPAEFNEALLSFLNSL